MTLTDKEKIKEITEILSGLRWYGGEYRYKIEGVEPSEYVSDDWERDNIDDMIEKIKEVVES